MKKREKFYSAVLTFIQYGSLVFLLGFNPWFSRNPWLFAIQIAGIITGIWAIITMSKSKLNISPIPRPGAVLVRDGLYRYIRHPMYLSLLLFVPPLVERSPGAVNLLVFSVFFINLLAKMYYEERLLKCHFEGYEAYMKETRRLIPYVY